MGEITENESKYLFECIIIIYVSNGAIHWKCLPEAAASEMCRKEYEVDIYWDKTPSIKKLICIPCKLRDFLNSLHKAMHTFGAAW